MRQRAAASAPMLVHADGRWPEIGFENGREDRRARWPDPDFPQQAHLDLLVDDDLMRSHRLELPFGFDPSRA
mgnify:CR=1 FL=1